MSGQCCPEDGQSAVAWSLARELLADPLPRRWRHSQGVCKAATLVGPHVTEDNELLSRAAVLHDIGYAPPLVETGFHAIDGARYLRCIGMDGGQFGSSSLLCDG